MASAFLWSPGEGPLGLALWGAGPPNLSGAAVVFPFRVTLGLCDFHSCVGAMPSLTVFVCGALLHAVYGKCLSCFGGAYGCSGQTELCPWVTGLAANRNLIQSIAVGVVAASSSLAIKKLLPVRFRRLFGRPTLDILLSIVSKPRDGGEFSPEGKSVVQIVSAIKAGTFSKSEAMLFLVESMQELDLEDTHHSTRVKQLQASLDIVKEIPDNLGSTAASSAGAYFFILAKLSVVICREQDLSVTLDACFECEEEDNGGNGSSSSTSGGTKAASATLRRPKSVGNMMMLLNDFVLVCTAVGLATPLVLCPFLADVVYIPISEGVLEWPVAFELLLIYLQEVDRQPDTWTLATIFAGSGAIDVRRKDAAAIAKARYPPSIFRAHGGNPGIGAGGGGKKYDGEVKLYNATSKRGCSAWNDGTAHDARSVDANGRCKYKHACNQWVTDKGKGGQCLGDHKRKECNYDESKKCSSAVSA